MSDLTWEQILAFAREGECWICGRTGFKRIANHTASAHDLTADDIRERYGLSWGQGLCTPEAAAEQSTRSKSLGLGGAAPHPKGKRPRPPRPLGAQAKAGLKEKANRPDQKELVAARNRDPEFNAKRAEGLRRSPLAAEQRAKALAASLKKRQLMKAGAA